MFKVKINEKTTVDASVWTRGGSESFLVHVMCTLGYCKRSDLFNKWKDAKKSKATQTKEIKSIKEYLNVLIKIQNKPIPMESNKEPKEESPPTEEQEEAQGDASKTRPGRKRKGKRRRAIPLFPLIVLIWLRWMRLLGTKQKLIRLAPNMKMPLRKWRKPLMHFLHFTRICLVKAL